MEKLLSKRSNHEFSSWTTTGSDFISFARDLKKELKLIAKNLWAELTMWKPWHYMTSRFMSRNDKHVYWSVGDVRRGSIDRVMLRTAQHTKDWTWWSNTFSTLEKVQEQTEYLLTRD